MSGNKKMRYGCVFKYEWQAEYKWLEDVKGNNRKAKCKWCNKEFAIDNQGLHQVKQHAETNMHKNKSVTHRNNTLIEVFCSPSKPSDEDNKALALEVTMVYHNVRHNLSYNSLDCNIKVLKHTIPEATKKVYLGRTKAEAIVLSVLGVQAIQEVIDNLKSGNIYFGVQIDASNVKNRKFFPITVQYFEKNKGIINKIINFVENPDESALGMFKIINETIKKLNLSFQHVSCLSADNCNANFGANNSLYNELLKENPKLIKANCHAHIIHNTVRYMINDLNYDVENLVLKIYAHFSVSAKKRETLKEFSEFNEVQYSELSRHVITRWLTLNPSIEKILKLWKPLLSYFRSLKDCPKILQKLLYINDDEYLDTPDNNIPELYLLFLNGFLKIFEDAILVLESNDCTIVEVYHVYNALLDKIKSRAEQQFFGFIVSQKNKEVDQYHADGLKKDFLNVYQRSIKYLCKWFDFSTNSLPLVFSKLKMDHKISYTELSDCVKYLPENLNINMDTMFDEVSILHKVYELCKGNTDFFELSESQKWTYIFSKLENEFDLANIEKIISFVFSIPASTAFVERIFSIMFNKWTDIRNRASVELIKSELCITVNIDMSCTEFYDHAVGNQVLLNKCKNDKKYHRNI